jgi:hypothetical protein
MHKGEQHAPPDCMPQMFFHSPYSLYIIILYSSIIFNLEFKIKINIINISLL